MKILAYSISALLLAACSQGETTIVVSNTTDLQRNNEVVAIPVETATTKIADNQNFIIVDQLNNEIPYQITSDGQVIFQASVNANAQSTYTIVAGTPAQVATIATGRQYPERVDDIAWENDRIAFRTYGPALAASGERAFGYDVWLKSVDYPVVEARYNMELNPVTLAAIDSLKAVNPDSAVALRQATSYHVDHGNGLDCYKVGPTLGGGTAAIMIADSIVYPYCYTNFEVLDNGPLRFTVKLAYNTNDIYGQAVTETRIVSLDAGSQLNRTVVSFSGLSDTTTVAAGIVLHDEGARVLSTASQCGYIGYADPTEKADNGNGSIFVGAVVPNATEVKTQLFSEVESQTLRGGALGHLLCKASVAPSSSFTYYWGGGWTKYGFQSINEWEQYLKQFAFKVSNPLVVTVK